MTTPYIIFSKKNCSSLRPCVVESYGLIKYELPFINALCVEVPKEKLCKIKENRRVAMIANDIDVSKLPASNYSEKDNQGLSLAKKMTFIENQGYGTTVAVIDTGLAPHYDLIKPYNRILAFKDFINDKELPYDDDGHGTHVTGIIAGNGYCLGGRDTTIGRSIHGTAPLANIVAIKALDSKGNGTTSDILAAMQWIVDNKEKYKIKLLNLSLGVTVGENPTMDPLVIGTTALIARGITVVTAAGNSGPNPCSITSPGINPYAITVGSFGNFGIPDFSSRGPTPLGHYKPDVVAPGVDIISADAVTCKQYVSYSGTSMSCPYVSGLVACLYSEKPSLTPRQIKKILMASSSPFKGIDINIQGAGAL